MQYPEIGKKCSDRSGGGGLMLQRRTSRFGLLASLIIGVGTPALAQTWVEVGRVPVIHIVPEGAHEWKRNVDGCDTPKGTPCYYVYRAEYRLPGDFPAANGDRGPYKYSLWYGIRSESGKFELTLNIAYPGVTISEAPSEPLKPSAMGVTFSPRPRSLFRDIHSAVPCTLFAAEEEWEHGGVTCGFGDRSEEVFSLLYDRRNWRTFSVRGPFEHKFKAAFFQLHDKRSAEVIVDVPISIGRETMSGSMRGIFKREWEPEETNLPSPETGLIGPVSISAEGECLTEDGFGFKLLSLSCLTEDKPDAGLQHWFYPERSDGRNWIVNRVSGLCLKAVNDRLVSTLCDKTSAQSWTVESYGSGSNKRVIIRNDDGRCVTNVAAKGASLGAASCEDYYLPEQMLVMEPTGS